ncbi:LOW QUALITY PROTEIN: BTB/POZ domain-containing protein KCTD16 [Callorhinchus milii]|uniref:LOW QUALITY PROTEIN: BTB/POZ domain-containing protein KCTD16 n=1 Tax=Callorhinchus milii TaxID=7868 RepID=UPI001C3FCEAA|nr:LOW QUALITY PROTEIN: BTB/POZ domain-containing protein KCTD16 [Callorhinchus milii]
MISLPDVVELNVGGQVYFTRLCTLTSSPNSVLGRMFGGHRPEMARDGRGRFFIDRDGFLFRYILDYLRDRAVLLPELFPEKQRLRREAEYFQLPDLVRMLSPAEGGDHRGDHRDHHHHRGGSPGGGVPDETGATHSDDPDSCRRAAATPGVGAGGQGVGGGGGAERKAGFITLGYRGPGPPGRDGVPGPDPRLFRRVPRILACGRVGLLQEVFGDHVNESRDPDRTPDRYTSRFYLRHRQLERAFDTLADSGFSLLGSNCSLSGPPGATGTTGATGTAPGATGTEDRAWSSYTEYLFYRSSSRWPSPQCDCGCRSNKGEKDGESVTSCNELSTSSCDSQSEASSPQETVICGPVTRQPNFQTLDRANKKGPVQHLQQSEFRRKSDLLRTLTSGSRESNTCKKKGKEKMTIEEELEKCIQDFLKIKIPDRFPERKYPWQMDLLRKYHL